MKLSPTGITLGLVRKPLPASIPPVLADIARCRRRPASPILSGIAGAGLLGSERFARSLADGRVLGQGLVCAILLCLMQGPTARAAAVFTGPVPYLSAADIPLGFYASGLPTALEDFEDGSLDHGITASAGTSIFGPDTFADSVDGDDGAIDGSGQGGKLLTAGTNAITLFMPAGVTRAAVVWTDGFSPTTFEAFGPGMVSLGTIGPVAISDGSLMGTTAEDHFFGVADPGGIMAIRLTNTSPFIELDHVQYQIIPLPAAPAMGLALLAGLGLLRAYRRRTGR